MTEQPQLSLQDELLRLASGLEASSKQLGDMCEYMGRVAVMARQGALQAAVTSEPTQQVDVEKIAALNSAFAGQVRRLCYTLQLPENTRVDDVFNIANDLLRQMQVAPPVVEAPVVATDEQADFLPTPVVDELTTREMLMAAILKDWQLGLLRTYLSPATWPNGTGVVRHLKGVLDKYQEDILKVDFHNLFKWPVGFYVSSDNGATQLMLRQNDIVIILSDLSTTKTVPLVVFRHRDEDQNVGYAAVRLDELDEFQYQSTYAVAKEVLEALTVAM